LAAERGFLETEAAVKILSPEERDAKALDLRVRNWPYPEIVTLLGYASVEEVEEAVRRANKAFFTEKVEDNRQLDSHRINELIKGLWNRSRAGDLSCIDRVIKLLDRRAKLLGLDMPTKTALTNADGSNDLVNMLSDAERAARVRVLLGVDLETSK
jgi:hypothetical protein